MTLKNIKITVSQKEYYETHYMDLGAESNIYQNKKNTIIKIWKDEVITEQQKENKKEKLVKMYERKLKYIPNIISTYSLGDSCIGYEMSYNKDDMAMLIAPLDKEGKIEVLKKMKAILQYFASEGVIYPDIKNDNILLNPKTGDITFCDIDNSKVDNLPVDLYPYYASRFNKRYGQEDSSLHSYMLNLYTLTELTNTWQDEVIEGISKDAYHDMFKEKGKTILKQMKKITPKYSGEYLIDYIKK